MTTESRARRRDEDFMRQAIVEAARARDEGDVPVGCVLVRDDAIIARGRNLRERTNDPTAHAEIVALREAAGAVGSWRLLGTTAYVTLEPCSMCAGAFVNARVARVVYGCADPKAGAVRTLYRIGEDERLNHRFDVTDGVLAEACALLLSAFFRRLRSPR